MKRAVPILLALPLLFAAAVSHAQSAVDERAVIAAASALDAAIDDKDWGGVRGMLLDEVTVALPGEEPGRMAADALVARWRVEWHAAKTTFHLRGGERVTFDGADSVVLRSKAHVTTRVEGIVGDDLHELRADYHHELDRTENGWRVRHYGYVPRLERGNMAVIEHRLAAPPSEAAAEETPDAAGDDAEADDVTDPPRAAEAESAGPGPADTDPEKADGAAKAAPAAGTDKPADGG